MTAARSAHFTPLRTKRFAMEKTIDIQVKRGTKVNLIEVDEIEDGYNATIRTGDDKKLKVQVMRLEQKPGISSKVVDVVMCG